MTKTLNEKEFVENSDNPSFYEFLIKDCGFIVKEKLNEEKKND